MSHTEGTDLVATNSDANNSPANPQGGAEQELRQALDKILDEFFHNVTMYEPGISKDPAAYPEAIAAILALTQAHTAAAYTQGYDDCLREHGAVFKGEEK